MAAVLGISNCGQDGLFKGDNPSIRPKDVRKYKHDVTAESVAWDFCNHFCETESMAEYHIEEVNHWYNNVLGRMSVEEVRKTWPYYNAFLDAASAPY